MSDPAFRLGQLAASVDLYLAGHYTRDQLAGALWGACPEAMRLSHPTKLCASDTCLGGPAAPAAEVDPWSGTRVCLLCYWPLRDSWQAHLRQVGG